MRKLSTFEPGATRELGNADVFFTFAHFSGENIEVGTWQEKAKSSSTDVRSFFISNRKKSFDFA